MCIVCIVYVSFSIHMCMYCMYCMYEHVCCMNGMYWPRQARMPAQRPQKTPRWGGTPRAPLRAPLGRWPTTFLGHRRPTPRPVLAHPRVQHALGGPKCTPCAANRECVCMCFRMYVCVHMYTSNTCNITCHFQYIHICNGRFTDEEQHTPRQSMLAFNQSSR